MDLDNEESQSHISPHASPTSKAQGAPHPHSPVPPASTPSPTNDDNRELSVTEEVPTEASGCGAPRKKAACQFNGKKSRGVRCGQENFRNHQCAAGPTAAAGTAQPPTSAAERRQRRPALLKKRPFRLPRALDVFLRGVGCIHWGRFWFPLCSDGACTHLVRKDLVRNDDRSGLKDCSGRPRGISPSGAGGLDGASQIRPRQAYYSKPSAPRHFAEEKSP